MKIRNSSAAFKRLSAFKRLLVLLLVIVVLLAGCGSALTTSGIKQADGSSEFAGPKQDKIQSSETDQKSNPKPDPKPAQNTQQDTEQDTKQDAEQDTEQDTEQDANQDANQDVNQNANQDVNQNANQKSGSDQKEDNSDNSTQNPKQSVSETNSPETPTRPFYTHGGEPPKAPGLVMKQQKFQEEPKKMVYLTIDDGPHPYTTPKILKILEEEKVPATFFVIGSQAEKFPDLLKAEYEGGFSIGNHTYSHDYKGIYQSPEAFLENIRKGEEIIERITGERPTIIRAPGGTQTHFGINYYNLLDANGYLVYDWNVSIGDAAAPLVPVEQLLKNLQTQMANRDRAIILMHDAGGKSTTVEALPKIIKYLKDKGYAFGALTPEVMPIIFPGGFSR